MTSIPGITIPPSIGIARDEITSPTMLAVGTIATAGVVRAGGIGNAIDEGLGD